MRASRILLCAVVCVWAPLFAHGQTVPPISPGATDVGGGPFRIQDFVSTQSTLRALLLGVTLTAWSSRYDDEAQRAFSSEGWWGNDLVDAGDAYGHGICLAGLTAATWGAGLAAGNSAMRDTGGKMALGLVVDAAVVNSVKLISGRLRPDGSDTRSFPSGHTSGAFTISTILSRRHGWRIGLPAYALASMTALARMEDSKHYASDVVAGAVLGIIVGRLVTPVDDEAPSRLHVISGPSRAGLQFSF